MEKLLTVLGCLGVTLVVVGTLTACQANKEAEIQSAASQVEISTESSVPCEEVSAYDKLPEEVKTGERVPTEEEMNSLNPQPVQDKIEKAEDKMISEAKHYWDTYRDRDLSVEIKNGLEYEEFEKLYMYYRAGIDEVLPSDTAYEFTVIELNRLYGETPSDYEALDPSTNMVKNADYTYTFTEEFIGTITAYDYFENATDEEINDFLQGLGGIIEGLSGQDVHNFMQLFEGGNLHKENETIRQSQGTAQTNQSQSTSGQSNSNSGNNGSSQSNNQTSQSNSQPVESSGTTTEVAGSADSLFGQSGSFGGGELIDGGHEWNIH